MILPMMAAARSTRITQRYKILCISSTQSEKYPPKQFSKEIEGSPVL